MNDHLEPPCSLTPVFRVCEKKTGKTIYAYPCEPHDKPRTLTEYTAIIRNTFPDIAYSVDQVPILTKNAAARSML